MRRREFIIGAVAATSPIRVRAQSAERKRRIGVLISRDAADPEGQAYVAAFERGLEELGWSPGRQAELIYRWQPSGPQQREAFLSEMAAFNPDVLIVSNTSYLIAVREAAIRIPIIIVAVTDPVAQGFVDSLAHPGGNITGFGAEEPSMGAKWVELLKEIAPDVGPINVIFNPDTAPFARMYSSSMEAMGPAVSKVLTLSPVRSESDIERAVALAARLPSSGLVFVPDSYLVAHREFAVGIIAKYRLPAIYFLTALVKSGGLISYGIDRVDLFYRAAAYVDRVLKGEKPSALPVQMPTKFELSINMKTARALGLTVPPTLLARADEVIE
jgi:putative ABC transport system substrate-binding protein